MSEEYVRAPRSEEPPKSKWYRHRAAPDLAEDYVRGPDLPLREDGKGSVVSDGKKNTRPMGFSSVEYTVKKDE